MKDRINYRHILHILWEDFRYMKGRRALYAIGGIFALGKLAVSYLVPYLYQVFIRLMEAGAGYIDMVWEIGIPFLLVVALVPLVCAGGYWQRVSANMATANMQRDVFGHTMRLPVLNLETDRADKVMRATANVQSAASLFSGYTMTIVFKFVIYFFGSFLILLFLNWRYAVIGLGLCALMFWLTTSLNVRLRSLERRALEADSSAAARVLELVSNLPMVKLLSIEALLSKKFDEDSEESYRSRLSYKAMRGVTDGILDFMGYSVQAAAILFGIRLLSRSGDDFASLLYVASMLSLMLTGMREMGNAIMFIQNPIVNSQRVFDLLKEPREPNRVSAAAVTPTGDCAVELRDICFSYEPGHPVLRNMTIRIMRGKMTAIVGESGCGKSTILKLIERFYQPDSGEIFLFGTAISQLSNEDVRACFSYVPQDAQLFDGTIRDNILLGDAARNEEAIRKVMAVAALSELDEYTQVGERGAQLSGGQAQRVAIARALRKNAPIYLLDEATAALDSDTERAIQAMFEDALKGKTVVCVAHRLSTIRHADQIVYMEKGQAREVGTHEELMAKKAGYYALYNAHR